MIRSPRGKQTFTVLGTVILEGTGERCRSGKRCYHASGRGMEEEFRNPCEAVEGAPRYRGDRGGQRKRQRHGGEWHETAGDGTPLFYKDEPVMLSIAPR